MSETFSPGIVTQDGRTIYPTGTEWLLAFAIKGFKWAEDLLPEATLNHAKKEIAKTLGAGI